jgi:hypothetical protein
VSRRKLVIPDSLELLLDTICNTFGAVIFISILLSLMVRGSGVQEGIASLPEEVSAVIAARNQEIAQAKARQVALELQLAQQQDVLDRFASAESKGLANEIMAAADNQVQLLEQKTDVVEGMTQAESQALTMEATMKQQALKLQQTQQQHKALMQEMQQATTLSSRTARIPRIRRTEKFGLAYMLHEGRLYRATTPDGEIDKTDCVRTEAGGVIRIAPRAASGMAVSEESVAGQGHAVERNKLQAKFERIDKARQFVRLFVSRNSFAQFIAVKDALIEQGLEYEVILFSDGKAELFLSDQQQESFVQ